jgi:hypothetical protein
MSIPPHSTSCSQLSGRKILQTQRGSRRCNQPDGGARHERSRSRQRRLGKGVPEKQPRRLPQPAPLIMDVKLILPLAYARRFVIR